MIHQGESQLSNCTNWGNAVLSRKTDVSVAYCELVVCYRLGSSNLCF
ncbi:MAG: hypothetical protein ACYSSO_15490 [Planctomycetota bacterium]